MGLQGNGMAVPGITWEGLTAWCALMRIVLEPWEAQALVRLGALRASVLSESDKNGAQDQARSN